jgi:two-component system response regulator RegA
MSQMPRLLLVEDDSMLLDVLRVAFTQRGWEVSCATSVAEAISAFSQQTPDVVLTDKNLPGGAITASQAGVELVRQLRQRDRAVGIVMMTGYGTMESARDTLNLGVDEYLEKPFASLAAVISRCAALAEKATQRRAALAGAPRGGPLTIVVAANPSRSPAVLQILDGTRDRVLHVSDPDEVKPSAKSENADVVILDSGSYPDEITSLVVAIKTRVRTAACVVLSQELALGDVKRLIELEVRALIDAPIGDARFPTELRSAVERLRR